MAGKRIRHKKEEGGKGYRMFAFLAAFLCIVLLIAVGLLIRQLRATEHSLETWEGYASALQGISGIGEPSAVHMHADFAVYVNERQLSFNVKEYNEKNPLVHVHLDNPEGSKVIHIHSTGMTFGHFLRSLGMDITESCLILPGGRFCNNLANTLKFYVNGEPNRDYGNYRMKDHDKILVSYGTDNESALYAQITSVTEYSRDYSSNPEKG